MMSNYVKNVICESEDSSKIPKRKKVKIKKAQSCDDESRYVAFYKDKVYAISTEYQLVYDYMTVHRKLSSGEFEIELLDSHDLRVSSNIDCELVEFHNLYVTDRDVVMSRLFMKDVNTELRDLQISLIGMARIIGQRETNSSVVNQMMKTCLVIDTIRSDSEYVEELEEICNLDNKFIYSDMDTYQHLLSQYEFYFNAYRFKSLF